MSLVSSKVNGTFKNFIYITTAYISLPHPPFSQLFHCQSNHCNFVHQSNHSHVHHCKLATIMDTSITIIKKKFSKKNYGKMKRISVFCPFFVFYYPIMDRCLPVFSSDKLQNIFIDEWVPDNKILA